jgi:hypothetical protein
MNKRFCFAITDVAARPNHVFVQAAPLPAKPIYGHWKDGTGADERWTG